jgi:hypothetical protein
MPLAPPVMIAVFFSSRRNVTSYCARQAGSDKLAVRPLGTRLDAWCTLLDKFKEGE